MKTESSIKVPVYQDTGGMMIFYQDTGGMRIFIPDNSYGRTCYYHVINQRPEENSVKYSLGMTIKNVPADCVHAQIPDNKIREIIGMIHCGNEDPMTEDEYALYMKELERAASELSSYFPKGREPKGNNLNRS